MEPNASLAHLYASLGALVRVEVDVPGSDERAVADAQIHDPLDTLRCGAGDVVLAAGLRPDQPAAVELAVAAAEAGAAAIVFKRHGDVGERLHDIARERGIALLTTPVDVAWEQLHLLIGTATLAGGGAASDGGRSLADATIGDLFALAEATAAMAGGPVTIEDAQSRVLAFANRDAPLDAGRRATILGRRVPESWIVRLRESGVFRHLERSDEVIRVEFPDELLPRRAIAVRAGGRLLGSVWLAEGEEPLDPRADAALEEAARLAALHLLRHRVSDDLDRRLRGDMLLAVLRGEGRSEQVEQLELPPAACVVMAYEAAGPAFVDGAVEERAVDLIAMVLRSFRREAAVVGASGRVFALVAVTPGESRSGLKRLLRDTVTTTERALRGVELRAGLGGEVAEPIDAASSCAQAEQALRVARAWSGPEAVVDIEEVAAEALLLDFMDFAAARPAARARQLDTLREHDAKRATDYLETLRVYLDCHGDTALATQRLNVHANTLRYRLKRVEEMTGIALRDPLRRLALELQLACDR